MSALPKSFLTPEQYLETERAAPFKSEYYRGEMFAMAGARIVHNLIVANLAAELRSHFRSRPCIAVSNDLRVRVSTSSYTYPDVVAVCGERKFLDDQTDTLLNPTLLAEVLSPSTEGYDRGLKFEQYRLIESLREYLMLSSERIHADLYTRQPDGRWLLTSADQPDDILNLESVGARLTLRDLYEKVDFTTP